MRIICDNCNHRVIETEKGWKHGVTKTSWVTYPENGCYDFNCDCISPRSKSMEE